MLDLVTGKTPLYSALLEEDGEESYSSKVVGMLGAKRTEDCSHSDASTSARKMAPPASTGSSRTGVKSEDFRDAVLLPNRNTGETSTTATNKNMV